MKLLVVDGHNLLVRAIKAMQFRPERTVLTTSSGVVTGPLVAFVNTLSQHLRAENPSHVVVCWDGGKSPHRLALDPGYKGNRTAGSYGEEIGPDSPFTLAKQFLTLAKIPWLLRQDTEADDLVAAYVNDWKREHPDDPAVILSNDKDFFQLVDEHVTQIRIGTGDTGTERVDVAWVEAKFGIHPKHYGKILALTGDTGDNVIGVAGIGPKTAVKMLISNDFDMPKLVVSEPKVHPMRAAC